MRESVHLVCVPRLIQEFSGRNERKATCQGYTTMHATEVSATHLPDVGEALKRHACERSRRKSGKFCTFSFRSGRGEGGRFLKQILHTSHRSCMVYPSIYMCTAVDRLVPHGHYERMYVQDLRITGDHS